MNRILIDCSILARSDAGTGIQRVVRNIAREAVLDEENNVIPVYWDDGQFLFFDDALLNKIVAPPESIESDDKSADASLEVRMRSGLLFCRIRLQSLLPPKWFSLISRIVYFFIRRGGQVLRKIKTLVGISSRSHAFEKEQVIFSQDDTLLLLDSSWNIPFWREVMAAKSAGVSLGFVAYDMIPFQHPEFCAPELVRVFRRWYMKAFRVADFSFSISEATKSDMHALIEGAGIKPSFKSYVFPMGADLDSEKELSGDDVRSEVRDFLSQKGVYLSVGTIEPRKNHRYIVEAFELLWREGGKQKLAFMGRVGWIEEKDLNYMREVANKFSDRFKMFGGVSDDELSFAYKKSTAVIIASVTEGFGLPIIESLHRGTSVFASDIPVFREVGRDNAHYFSIQDHGNSLRGLIGKEEVSPVKKVSMPSWKKSYLTIIKKIELLHESKE